MIKFDKLEEIYKDKKANTILLIASVFAFALNVTMFIVYIVSGNLYGVALTGLFLGMFAVMTIWLAITQVAINKEYKEEQDKIEMQTIFECQKILMNALTEIDKQYVFKGDPKYKAEQEKAKAEAEKPKAKKKTEPKAKAGTKTTKKKN